MQNLVVINSAKGWNLVSSPAIILYDGNHPFWRDKTLSLNSDDTSATSTSIALFADINSDPSTYASLTRYPTQDVFRRVIVLEPSFSRAAFGNGRQLPAKLFAQIANWLFSITSLYSAELQASVKLIAQVVVPELAAAPRSGIQDLAYTLQDLSSSTGDPTAENGSHVVTEYTISCAVS